MSDFTPAKRGQIAVTQKIKRGYSLVAGCYSHLDITVGTVSSVSRDGTVKRVKPESVTAAELSPRDWDSIQLVNGLSDPKGFLAECRDRQDTSADKYRPFEDLNDVRETARKYL